MHEIGHTQDLKHCPDQSCIMRAAEGKITWMNSRDSVVVVQKNAKKGLEVRMIVFRFK
ncbi:MAG: hypothetical protein IPF63_12375 [Bacteroidetes bacterium]|nr:hypothetical protein [Bacteroidota bacterium]